MMSMTSNWNQKIAHRMRQISRRFTDVGGINNSLCVGLEEPAARLIRKKSKFHKTIIFMSKLNFIKLQYLCQNYRKLYI